MPSKASSRVLIDHDEIQRWAEDRGAKPSAVRNTSGGDEVGIIRLDFPGFSGGESLEEIEWDEWFEKFDDNNLALVVQEKTANGQRSNFNKLVNRENVETSADEESESSSRRSSARRSASSRSTSGRGTKSKAAGARASSASKGASAGGRSARSGSEGREAKRRPVSRASQKTTRSRKKAA
jgi:hypothetical protein